MNVLCAAPKPEHESVEETSAMGRERESVPSRDLASRKASKPTLQTIILTDCSESSDHDDTLHAMHDNSIKWERRSRAVQLETPGLESPVLTHLHQDRQVSFSRAYHDILL
jgi:hypothetical protein